MPKELYVIYVIDAANESEIDLAKQYRANKANCNFHNARYFNGTTIACSGVVLGKGVAKQYPLIRSAYEPTGTSVKDLDEAAPQLDEIAPESITVSSDADDIYSWTREQCINWLSVRGIKTSPGYVPKSELQAQILEHLNNG